MPRKIYRVVPDRTEWTVKHEAGGLSRHVTKDAALAAGRGVALANQPSQLVVHLANGQVEAEWTYGDDPHSPTG